MACPSCTLVLKDCSVKYLRHISEAFVRHVGKGTRQFHSGAKSAACASLDGVLVSHQEQVNLVSKLVRHVGEPSGCYMSAVPVGELTYSEQVVATCSQGMSSSSQCDS